jgi:hypothetical protein
LALLQYRERIGYRFGFPNFTYPSACNNRDAYNCAPPAGPTGFDGSWGFRSRATTDLGALNIAIPAVLWPNGGHALSFDLYESLLLGNPAFYGGGIASVGTPTPNTPETTVLAALAHELGHVRWAMTTVQPYVGGSYYFGTL